jgi:hypothetical protein
MEYGRDLNPLFMNIYTRWFKYDRDKLWLVYTQSVPVIFEPPCTTRNKHGVVWYKHPQQAGTTHQYTTTTRPSNINRSNPITVCYSCFNKIYHLLVPKRRFQTTSRRVITHKTDESNSTAVLAYDLEQSEPTISFVSTSTINRKEKLFWST